MTTLKMTPTRAQVLRAVAAGVVSESRGGDRRVDAHLDMGQSPIRSLRERLYELRTARLVRLVEPAPQWDTYMIKVTLTEAGVKVLADLDATREG